MSLREQIVKWIATLPPEQRPFVADKYARLLAVPPKSISAVAERIASKNANQGILL